jgi:FMN phosphatase YigB (HAD superfamily)
VRARKPDAAIYLSALEMAQCRPAECIMIDDRPENLEAPRQMGMHTIQYASPTQLRDELMRCGVASRTAGGH